MSKKIDYSKLEQLFEGTTDEQEEGDADVSDLLGGGGAAAAASRRDDAGGEEEEEEEDDVPGLEALM